MCDSIQGSLCPSSMKIHQSMWIQWPFFKNLNQKSLIPRWPLTLHLLRSHVWLYPWEYIDVCGYNDQFCKIPHTIDTTYIYYVQNAWSFSLFLNTVQARQEAPNLCLKKVKQVVKIDAKWAEFQSVHSASNTFSNTTYSEYNSPHVWIHCQANSF